MRTISIAGGRTRLLKGGSSSTLSAWMETTSTGTNISWAATGGSKGTSSVSF